MHRGDFQLLQRAGEVSTGHDTSLGFPPAPAAAPGAEATRQLEESQVVHTGVPALREGGIRALAGSTSSPDPSLEETPDSLGSPDV